MLKSTLKIKTRNRNINFQLYLRYVKRVLCTWKTHRLRASKRSCALNWNPDRLHWILHGCIWIILSVRTSFANCRNRSPKRAFVSILIRRGPSGPCETSTRYTLRVYKLEYVIITIIIKWHAYDVCRTACLYTTVRLRSLSFPVTLMPRAHVLYFMI